MKKLLLLIFLLQVFFASEAQHLTQKEEDSLFALYSPIKKDTQQVWILSRLSLAYNFKSPDSGLLFAKKELELSQALDYKRGELDARYNMAIYWWSVGEYSLSAKLFTENIEYYRKAKMIAEMGGEYGVLFNVYRDQGDLKQALECLHISDSIARVLYTCTDCTEDSTSIGSVYFEVGQYDSALAYLKFIENTGSNWPWGNLMLGKAYAKTGNEAMALKYYYISIPGLIEENNLKNLSGAYNSLAELYKNKKSLDSALYYANKSLELAQQKKFNKEMLEAYLTLSDTYNSHDPKLALNYLKLAFVTKDTLYNQEKQRQILSYKFNEELRQQETEKAEAQYKNQIKIYILLGILIVVVAIGIILWRYNRQRKKAYAQLEEQQNETDQQRAKAEQALAELKSAQSQLIQSEKMASLGELTAGIAHEIQNPLNFVNNFSEVNNELIEELKSQKPKLKSEEQDEILNNIFLNNEKITFHGKRADAIVKGMLQHSRASTGKKEPTDINGLCDEYLRLSYHGMRAKDKSFNATLQTDFDNSIGKINVVPQDIGRVLLNLFNNAFYAAPLPPKGGFKNPQDKHQPTVWVSTKKQGDRVLISVKDTGPGIPQNIIDKIFQPFFTTKPTGQGTGLGLSLSYDIIKAHGGEIKVETKEGEGAEFIVLLPS